MRLPGRRKTRPSLTELEKAAGNSGAMVALYPSPEVAQAIAQEGGEVAEELHLTLAFLGEADDLPDDVDLQKVVSGFAATAAPLAGEISGIGHFTAGPEPVTYASADVPGLPSFRERLCEALCGAGVEPATDHGFTPHITLSYDHREPDIPNLPLAFGEIRLVEADQSYTYPLTGKQAAESVVVATKSEDGKRELTVPIWKDEAKQIVYGVVMQPDVPDSAGDWQSAEDIEAAAHRYLAESRKHDVQHEEEEVGVRPIESYIAPVDMKIAGASVLKGSWVMAVKVLDPEIWAAVEKNELTGFSIGGTGVREE